jgi:hypothetical protein
MPIPKEITRFHLAKAMQDLSKQTPDEKKRSTKFCIIINGITLEPKKIISRAGFYAVGRELKADEFTGTEAKAFLDNLGLKTSLVATK